MSSEFHSHGRGSGLPGSGFAVATLAVLLAGLLLSAGAALAGASSRASLGMLAGTLTAALGTLSWWVALRTTYARSPKKFLGALLGGVLFRMALYGTVLVAAALSGALNVGALLAVLFVSHLAYQALEVTALHRARKGGSPPLARAAAVAALALCLTLPAAPVLAAAPAGAQEESHPAQAESGHGEAAGGAHGEVPGTAHGEAAETAHGEAEHGEEHAFDVMHHVVDSREIETPFGAIHLPEGWKVAGIDLAPTKHVVWMWIAALITLLFVLAGARGAGMVPRGLGNALETVLVFIRDEIAGKNIGHHPERFTPYLATLFFFILFSNLAGLVPFGATATGNLNMTAGLAALSLIMIQGAGIRENGLVAHIKALCPIPKGVPGWLLPLYIPIIIAVEVVGIFAKPIALALRLFANMTAGHVVIVSLLGLIFILQSHLVVPVSVAFALFIYCLEVFVGFVQAYIFTMLTALFIGMSQHPAH